MDTHIVEKQALRRSLRQQLQALSPAERSQKSAALCRHLLASTAYQQAAHIFCYVSFGEEAETHGLLAQILKDGKTLWVPRICGPGEMQAHRISDLRQLQPGKYGIPEPPADAEICDPAKLELCLVPGVAFDKSGGRLGRGGGFYDRYLPQSGGTKIGLCFALQLQDAVPCDDHDTRVHAVCTEDGLFPAQK